MSDLRGFIARMLDRLFPECDPVKDACDTLVIHAIRKTPHRDHKYVHDLIGNSCRGVYIGSWRVTVEPIPTPASRS